MAVSAEAVDHHLTETTLMTGAHLRWTETVLPEVGPLTRTGLRTGRGSTEEVEDRHRTGMTSMMMDPRAEISEVSVTRFLLI